MSKTTSIAKLFGIELPIIQAPMAGAQNQHMAIAVSNAGGLGSMACSMISCDEIANRLASFRSRCDKPINLNFFCHKEKPRNENREAHWRKSLESLYQEVGAKGHPGGTISVRSFNDKRCELVEELCPEVVSFHFGLPSANLVERIKATGACIMSSATTVNEARYLADNGCDAIIAQGCEAGGHQGKFLDEEHKDYNNTSQIGTFSLVQQISASIDLPVVAAGGIANGRGIAAAFMLGASAAQIGTRYLKTPESTINDHHRQLLNDAQPPFTVLTNVFTGRLARSFSNRIIREAGPVSTDVPDYPYAIAGLAPLKDATQGSGDFVSLWAGQSSTIGKEMNSGALTRELATEAMAHLRSSDELMEHFHVTESETVG